MLNNNYYIFINNETNTERQRFTTAHEIGHILLKHNFKNLTYEQLEQEANMFAARILMPMCVLNTLNCETVEQIVNLCNVSFESATIRLERLNLIKSRNKFLTNSLEVKVLSNFKNFIKQH